jgi:hypothetical protein
MSLFGKKAKDKYRFCTILLRGKDRTVLFTGPLETLRFPEKLIAAKSLNYFNDPEPCFIHRGAVEVRLFEELNLLLEKAKTLSAAELDKSCPGYLDEYPGSESVEIIEKEQHDAP